MPCCGGGGGGGGGGSARKGTPAEQRRALEVAYFQVAESPGRKSYRFDDSPRGDEAQAKQWDRNVLPPIADGEPFGGREIKGVDEALKVAEEMNLHEPIMAARADIITDLYAVQLALCLSIGDARMAQVKEDRPEYLPFAADADMGIHHGNGHWQILTRAMATDKAKGTLPHGSPGYPYPNVLTMYNDFTKPVRDSIAKLVKSKALDTLSDLVGKMALAEYTKYEGYDAAKKKPPVPPARPSPETDKIAAAIAKWKLVQPLLRVAPIAEKPIQRAIPMADWTPEMRGEIDSANAKVASGAVSINEMDKIALKLVASKQEIYADTYLIVLAINRFEAFNAIGEKIAAKVDGVEWAPGPIKSGARIGAKCSIGQDYALDYIGGVAVEGQEKRRPECARVMDALRGSELCTSHDMMLSVYDEAVTEFGGEPLVCKDRRDDLQHDMLLVFMVDGFYVELQLHFPKLMQIKTLMHVVFDIQRLVLSTDKKGEKGEEVALVSTGWNTVINEVYYDDKPGDRAEAIKVLLHI